MRIDFENIEVREGATILAAIFNEQTTNNELLLGAKKKKERKKPDLSTSIIFYPLRS